MKSDDLTDQSCHHEKRNDIAEIIPHKISPCVHTRLEMHIPKKDTSTSMCLHERVNNSFPECRLRITIHWEVGKRQRCQCENGNETDCSKRLKQEHIQHARRRVAIVLEAVPSAFVNGLDDDGREHISRQIGNTAQQASQLFYGIPNRSCTRCIRFRI